MEKTRELQSDHQLLREENLHLKRKIAQIEKDIVALEESRRDLEVYADTVAHNLKGSLATIVGYSSFLYESYADLGEMEIKHIVRTIERGSRKMGRIIDDILLLSQISHSEFEAEPIFMRETIENALSRLQGLFDLNSCDIQIDNTWPDVYGRPSWVEEIWYNYISNGLKYGGTPPKLRLGATVLDDGWVQLWVQDFGEGLSPEAQKIIFNEFQRLTSQNIEGHGLGLPIVRRIALKMGGEAGVKSNKGLGSLFYFTLPSTAV